MWDLTTMLQASIRLDRDITDKQQLHLQPEHRLENAVVALDVELAEMANTAEWFKVWKVHRGKQAAGKTARETLLDEYVDALDFFFLVAAILQWTHLIPLADDELAKITAKPAQPTKLDQEYLALKKMLYGAYFDHQQASFKHAWHLFLKLGLVDFGFKQTEIQDAFQAKNKINRQRQADNY